MMIQELDTVILTHDIKKYGLKKGDAGATVHVYAGGKHFEVEFVAADGTTAALLTLEAKDVRMVGHSERLILPAREFIPATSAHAA